MKSILSGLQRLVQQKVESESSADMSGAQSSDSLPEISQPTTTEVQEVKSNEVLTEPNPDWALVLVKYPSPPLIIEVEDETQPSADRVPNHKPKDPEAAPSQPSVASRLRKRKSSAADPRSKKMKQGKGKGVAGSSSFDGIRFVSAEAEKRYAQFSQRNFIEEVELSRKRNEAAREFIEQAGLIRTATKFKPFIKNLVFEFWANLPTVKVDTLKVSVLVRNWEYELSPEKINEMYGLPSVDARQQRIYTAGLVDEQVAEFLTGGKVSALSKLQVSAFTPPSLELFKLCCSNWSPTSNAGYAQPDRAKLVYMVMHKIPFDFGRMAFDHILQLALKPDTKLFMPFPHLIDQLIQTQRPVQIPVHPPASTTSTKQKKVKPSASATRKESTNRRAMRIAIEILQAALDSSKCLITFHGVSYISLVDYLIFN